TSRKTTFPHETSRATPATKQTIPAEIGTASRNVSRVAGITITFTTVNTTSIATKVTSWVATTDSGTSCRGNRTVLTREALSTIDRDAVVNEVEKKSQSASPTRR